MENKFNFLKGIGQLILVFLVGYLVIKAAAFLTGEKSREEIVREIIKEVSLKRPTCPDTSDAYLNLKNSTTSLSLITASFKSYGAPDGSFVGKKEVVVKVGGANSQIACGYLYIKANVGNRPLREDENIYIKSGQFGGHIVENTAIINQKVENKSELLFNLNNIFYRENRNASEIIKADYAALFNVSNIIKFEIALNTTNPLGKIDEVNIAYKCWNPETGQETQDCQLSIEK